VARRNPDGTFAKRRFFINHYNTTESINGMYVYRVPGQDKPYKSTPVEVLAWFEGSAVTADLETGKIVQYKFYDMAYELGSEP
jgi:hypothetical protein